MTSFRRGIVVASAISALLISSESLRAAPLGEGWVVTIKDEGDESSLSPLGFTVEKSLDSQRRVFKIRAKSKSAMNRFRSLGLNSAFSSVETALATQDFILHAEPNYIYSSSSGARRPTDASEEQAVTPAPRAPLNFAELLPADPYFSSLWGMRNRGQSVEYGKRGIAGADVKATGAWVFERGSHEVVVAILDSGIDLEHEDLKDNLWRSSASADFTHGYNSFNPSLPPQDDNGHGTHVAGTIGAVGDNGLGLVGVSWKVSLMAIKILDRNGDGDLAGIVAGIDWAIANGAQVLNASWGGPGRSSILEAALKRASEQGILVVAAAGNDGLNNDTHPSYPANYNLPNILSVAASDYRDELAPFSNYGKNRVHLAAPGVAIYSTLPGNQYGTSSGTSMAAPHVSGTAALLFARHPSISISELKTRIIGGADRIATLKDRVGNAGARLNTMNAVQN